MPTNNKAEIEYAASLLQGSAEWLAFKLGKVGSSRIADITAKIRNGSSGASRATYQGELVAERLTGMPQNTYVNAAMQWGSDYEAEARALYQRRELCVIVQIGAALHHEIKNALASPDGLVDNNGLIEIKCPHITNNHIELLLGGEIPGRYQQQIMWQLACTGRDWCDFVSYDPRLPPSMQLCIKRLQRDDDKIAELECEVNQFLGEVDDRVWRLVTSYDTEAAA